MINRLDLRALTELIQESFSGFVDVQSVSPTAGLVDFVAYDAVAFRASVDLQTGVFGLILLLPGGMAVDRVLGREFSLNNDEKSIRESLALADQYCRLRLPESYLRALEHSRAV